MSAPPNANAANASFEFAALEHARNYRAALMREFAPHLRGRVIEVGSGVGHLTAMLRANPGVDELLAVEPDAGFCRRLRENLPGLDLTEGIAASLPPGTSGDALLSVNVLEHVEDDAGELELYRRLLAPRGGVLCLFVPAGPEIYAPLDRDFGHFRRYTKPELRDKLGDAGFEILRLNYFNCVGYFAWWASFCLLKKRRFDIASVKLFDGAIFPTVHWLESRVCRPPFGQSLIVAARAT